MPLPDPAVERLTNLLGDRYTTDVDILQQHAEDESSHPPQRPQAVAFPLSTEEVAEVVNVCATNRIPIVPYGRGTSVEGGIIATHGGLCVDLGRMNQILSINEKDLDAHVQAGVTQFQLNKSLSDSTLFFSVDPGAEATLGGMASTRASGTNTVRYGAMRENVLSVTAVLADGRVVRSSSRARKSSAGYDLTRLFVGAEGTLGLITELTVRLHRRPDALVSAVCAFETVDDAVHSVIRTVQAGIPVARVELLDEVAISAVNRYSQLDYSCKPTLFFEFQGTNDGVREQAQLVSSITRDCDGGEFEWATENSERDRLWQARHDAYYAMLALRPEARSFTTDVCVPVSRLAECIAATQIDLSRCPFPAPLLGHLGDGNFHVLMLVDPEDAAELRLASEVNSRIVQRAIEMDGTCTGEHGVGIGKREYLISEHGAGLGVMKQIKQALDPFNLMNPGKVLPPEPR